MVLPMVLASCVPSAEAPRAADARVQPVVRGQALLKRLALDVPVDLEVAAVAPPVAPKAALPFTTQAASAEDAIRAEDCLTAAIYYEARSEPLDGQRAVAQVVLNRVRDRAFPGSVCGVVYQGSQRSTGCQFSFTCDGSMDRPRNPQAWERSRAIAAAALAGSVYAPVGAATHYHANYVLPWWASSLVRVGTIGSHLFYRWGGQLERALAFRQDYAGQEPEPGRAPTLAGVEAAGVRILRGTQLVEGVAIHRGDAPEAEEAPVAGPVLVAGVRIHRGVEAPETEEVDPG
jgi:hypothetical protein